MPKTKIDALDEALAAVAALPAPRTQQEWRKVSTVLRTARRITVTRRRAMTIRVECGGSHRYLYAETHGPATGCYTGAMGLGSLRWIRHHACLYREGSTKGRIADARYFADVCRREGPVPLPGASPSLRTLLARHDVAYQKERSARRNGLDSQTCAVLMRDREITWRDLRAAMGGDALCLAA